MGHETFQTHSCTCERWNFKEKRLKKDKNHVLYTFIVVSLKQKVYIFMLNMEI